MSKPVVVEFQGDASKLVRAVEQSSAAVDKLARETETASAKMVRAGGKMQGIGQNLVPISASLAGVGLASLKMSADFDESMRKITGLVGVPAAEVDKLRGSVLSLAGETGRAPQELADALFAVTSAGFSGAEAMEVLERASRASAAGLGDTNTIALAVGSSVNAYGADALSAARATDIMVGTVKAGNLEASELAGALGKVLPVAAAASVELEDVGGAVALLTRSGASASEAVTQVQAAIRSMIAPNAAAVAALEAHGSSAAELRRVLAEQGLVAAMQLMQAATGGTTDAMSRAFGSSEALSGALTILNADASTIEGTFGAVARSTGLTDQAFASAASGSGYAMRQAFAEIQAAAIKMGDALAPVAVAVAKGVGAMASAFADLPGPIQSVVAGVVGLGAVTAPTVIAVGKVTSAVGALAGNSAMQAGIAKLGLSMASLGPVGIAAGAAAATAGVAYLLFRDRASDVEQATHRLNAALVDSAGRFDTSRQALMSYVQEASRFQMRNQIDDLQRLDISLGDVTDMLRSGTDGYIAFVAAAARSGEISQSLADHLIHQARTGEDASISLADLADSGQRVDAGNMDLITSFRTLQEAQQASAREAAEQMVWLEQITKAQLDAAVAANTAADGTTDWIGVQDTLNAELAASERATDDAAAATNELGAEADDTAQAVIKMSDAVETASGAMARLFGDGMDLDAALRDVEASLDALSGIAPRAAAGLDVTTEAGRENREALADAAQAALDHAQAMSDSGASAQQISGALNGYIASIIETGKAAGLSEQDIRDYLATLGLTPENVDTVVGLLGVESAEKALADFSAKADLSTLDRDTLISIVGEEAASAILSRFDGEADAATVARDMLVEVVGAERATTIMLGLGGNADQQTRARQLLVETVGASQAEAILRSFGLNADRTTRPREAYLGANTGSGLAALSTFEGRANSATRGRDAYVGINMGSALGGADVVNQRLDYAARDRVANIHVREHRSSYGGGSAGTPIALKTGGPVPGMRDAPVPATLHGGEFVLSADVVDAIKSGRSTLGKSSSGGSPSGGGNVINLTVNAGMGADGDEIGRVIVDALRTYGRRNGGVPITAVGA